MARRLANGCVALVVFGAAVGLLTLLFWGDGMPSDAPRTPASATAIPLAVLGDSGSHAYQDSLQLADPAARGGPNRARTFQWTEVLGRMRGQQIDQGPFVRWGRPGVVERAREVLGLPSARAPQKEDYLYNFANSGASCRNLMGTRFRQAPRLVALMDRDPKLWERGVVVIGIGGNDWSAFLDTEANNPSDPALIAANNFCIDEIRRAIALIRASHPSTRIVIVGLAGEADDPFSQHRWQTAAETANIRMSLGRFNEQLRQITVGDPRMAFFDHLRWLNQLIGGRTDRGQRDYKAFNIGPKLRITNTIGDDPHNTVMKDDHNGVALNALWAQSLAQLLVDSFGLPVKPISEDELARFLEPLFEQSRAPGS